MAKIRVMTKQGPTIDFDLNEPDFNFNAFTASVRAIGCIAIGNLYIPLENILCVMDLTNTATAIPEIRKDLQ